MMVSLDIQYDGNNLSINIHIHSSIHINVHIYI